MAHAQQIVQQAMTLELEGRVRERDTEIARLRERVGSLSEQLHRALYSSGGASSSSSSSSSHLAGGGPPASNENAAVGGGIGIVGSGSKTTKKTALSPHAVQVHTAGVGAALTTASSLSSSALAGPSGALGIRQERLGRNASIGTQRVLNDLSKAAAATASAAGGVPHGLQQHQPWQNYDARQRGSSGLGMNPFLRGSSGGGSLGAGPPAPQPFGASATPVSRVMQMFAAPAASLEYLTSPLFAKDLVKLCSLAKKILGQEPRCVFLQSPIYVFGDVHGNVEDLHFFADNIWRLGMECTAGRFLFLGDYVDRGLSCLECIAYLLALKVTLPNKLFLLRGNHETRDVNGWEEHYGDRSFIRQCTNRFGNDVGYRVWEACNAAFDRMPLAAVIDQDIFCVHGGIPRPIHPGTTTRIQDILTVPKVAGINPPYQHEEASYQQVASDCIWSDPASEEQELTSVDPSTGYGASLRGGGAICFGNKAVTDFLAQHNLSYILRAHEAHADGVAVSKGARVFTVFSTSKDHNQGSHALAGCILVDSEKLQVINRSPAYKNQYVHRRDSVSLASVPPDEIQKRMRLGLITQAPVAAAATQYQYQQHQTEASAVADTSMQATPSDEELQDWQDFESDSEEEDDGLGADGGNKNDEDEDAAMETAGAVSAATQQSHAAGKRLFDTNRRASIDLASLSENSHDDPPSIHEAAPDPAEWSYQMLAGGGLVGDDPEAAGRRISRSKKPSVSSIPEDDDRRLDAELQDAMSGDDDDL